MHQDLLNDLINALTILPGVGKKSAQRMALYLLDKNKDGAGILAKTMQEAVEEISRCERCRMLTSNSLCKICADTSRDEDSICVVESPSDVLAIESTGGFRGKYFVLLGRLSPIEGVSPEDLGINDFLNLIADCPICAPTSKKQRLFRLFLFLILKISKNTSFFSLSLSIINLT